jgi:hypothetical protein
LIAGYKSWILPAMNGCSPNQQPRKGTAHEPNLSGANLSEASLSGANLQAATLVNTDLRGGDLRGCRIYGVSAWGLKLEGAKQQNLVITRPDEPTITVDNIEVAQFVYLLLHNEKIREVKGRPQDRAPHWGYPRWCLPDAVGCPDRGREAAAG